MEKSIKPASSKKPISLIIVGILSLGLIAFTWAYQQRNQSEEHHQAMVERATLGMESHGIQNVSEYQDNVYRGDIGEFCKVQFDYRDSDLKVHLTSFPTVGDNVNRKMLPQEFNPDGSWSNQVYDLCIYGGVEYNLQEKELQY